MSQYESFKKYESGELLTESELKTVANYVWLFEQSCFELQILLYVFLHIEVLHCLQMEK